MSRRLPAALAIAGAALLSLIGVPAARAAHGRATQTTLGPAPRSAELPPVPSPEPGPLATAPVLDLTASDLAVSDTPLDIVLSTAALDSSLTVAQTAKQETVTLAADVLFAFGKADLSPDAQSRIAQAADVVKTKAKGEVHVDGYTDSVGGADYNQTLSQQRAQSVVNALQPLLNGVAVTLTAQGHGAANPVAGNTKPDGSDNPSGRALNRRVTITFAASS